MNELKSALLTLMSAIKMSRVRLWTADWQTTDKIFIHSKQNSLPFPKKARFEQTLTIYRHRLFTHLWMIRQYQEMF